MPETSSVDKALAYIATGATTWAGLLWAGNVLAAEVKRLREAVCELERLRVMEVDNG
jgi:hypothetical protein